LSDDPELRRLLWYLLGGTRGGESRARILHHLRKRPSNLNQIAKQLDFDYNAIQHHIEVLRRNSLVVSSGERYGMTYFLSPWLESHFEVLEDICRRLGYKLGNASDAPPS